MWPETIWLIWIYVLQIGDPIFGFLTGGLALAFVNGVLKTTLPKGESLFIMVPAVIFAQPYVLDSLPEVAGW